MKIKFLLSAIMLALSMQLQAQTTYYLDATSGSDNNLGTSESTAWRTLAKVNTIIFQPGDFILFKAGEVWNGELAPQGSGSASNPITIGKYGGTGRPVINGGTAPQRTYLYLADISSTTNNSRLYRSAVALVNQSYWTIQDLEVTNDAISTTRTYTAINTGALGTRGISVIYTTSGMHGHITVKNNYIHHVDGAEGKDGGAIVVSPASMESQAANLPRIDDITVEGNHTYMINGNAVEVRGGRLAKLTYDIQTTNVLIKNNYCENISVGALRSTYASSVFEHNLINGSVKRKNGPDVAIYTGWRTRDNVTQFNEVYNTHGTSDGQAFDCDAGAVNQIIQYNYSHNNSGGFIVLWSLSGPWYNFSDNCIIRYNISENDENRVIDIRGRDFDNLWIYNNTFYTTASNTFALRFAVGAPYQTVFVENNIFWHTDGTASHSSSNQSWGDFQNKTNASSRFHNNLIFGTYINNPPSGSKAANNIINMNPMLTAPGTGTIGSFDQTTRLVTTGNVDGYKLQMGSPAIGAGKNIPNNGGRDYWGNTVNATGITNIGAYNGPAIVVTNNNLALNKTASQSSTGGGGPASRAVDGNTNGIYGYGSVAHTGNINGVQDYWQVDLGQMADIDYIEVWNRTDCCASRLTNYHIFVSDNAIANTTVAGTQSETGVDDYHQSGQAGTPTTITMNTNQMGRYVRLQLESTTDPINLAELKVFGTYVNVTNSDPTDIALSNNITTENNTVNEIIGSFTTTDVDSGDAHTYSLVSGTGDSGNSNFNINGAELRASITFDYEIASSHSIRVRTTDSQGGFFEKVFTVNVLQISPISFFTANNTTISEGDTVSFTDESTNNPTSWNWTFAGGTPSSSTLQNPVVTYNTAGTYTVSLMVSNSAGGSSTWTEQNYITVNPSTSGTPMIASPEDDAFVRGGSFAGNIYGTDARLAVRNSSNQSYLRQSYLKFNVGTSTISDMSLELTPDAIFASGSIQIHTTTNNSWQEETLNFNNKPASSTETLLTTVSGFVQYQTKTIDLSPFLGNIDTSSGQVTFLLKMSTSGGNVPMASKEHPTSSYRPVLNYTVSSGQQSSNGNVILTALEDAYVRRGIYSSNNYGTENILHVKNGDPGNPQDPGDYDREAVLLFELPGDIQTVNSATLRLRLSYIDFASQVEVYNTNLSSFTEETVQGSWIFPSGNLIATTTVEHTTGFWYEWDVTNHIAANSSNTYIDLLLKSLSQWTIYFDSKEAGYAPELVIDYVPTGGTSQQNSSTYQAEDATITSGVVKSSGSGWNGTGYVDNTYGGSVEFNVNVAVSGYYDLNLNTTGNANGMALEVLVNGTVVNSTLAVPNQGSWSTNWIEVTQSYVWLNTGSNTIRFRDNGVNEPQMDQLELVPFGNTAKTSSQKGKLTEVEEEVIGFNIYPNPSKGRFNITYNSEIEEHLEIKLFDVSGKLIIDQLQRVNKGNNAFKLDFFGKAVPGLHFLQIKGSKQIIVHKVLIGD